MSEHHFLDALHNVQSITVAKVLVAVSFAVLLVSSLILYEARTSFLQRHVSGLSSTVQPSQLRLNAVSDRSLTDFIETHKDVAALSVVGVNLDENTSTPLVTLYNNRLIEQATKSIDSDEPHPLFTHNASSNATITALINGEFTCVPFGNITQVGHVKSEPLIKTTCRVPIPPYYGKLMGYLVIHSVREMSIYDIDQLRRDALRLSIDIYYANTSRVLNVGGGSPSH